MLKPINPSPFNAYITKDKHETIECEMPKNQKIIGDYTRIVDVETSKVVFDAYSQYEDIPKARIEYSNVLTKAMTGKEYSWNTFYWGTPVKEGTEYKFLNELNEGDNLICLGSNLKKDNLILSGMYIITNMGFDYGHIEIAHNLERAFNDERLLGKYAVVFDGMPLCGHNIYGKLCDFPYDITFDNLNDCILVALKTLELDNNGNYQILSSTEILDIKYNLFRDYCAWIYFDDKIFNDTIQNNSGEVYYCIFKKDSESTISENSLLSIKTEKGEEYYHCVRSVSHKNGRIECRVYPEFKCNFFNNDATDNTVNIFFDPKCWNISPDYYFRCKAEPTILINSTSKIKEVPETTDLGDITKNKLYDIESDFKVTFKPGENCTDMNYYQLHYYIKSDKDDYVLVEKSNKLFPDDAGYSFKGFVDGGSYKVVAICVDNDGDEWTEELCFDVSYDIKNSGNIINCVRFNEDDYSIKVNIESLISKYPDAENIDSDLPYSFKIYKQRKGYLFADYVGECSSWSPKLADHNIQNDMNYTYFLKVAKKVEDDSSDLDIEGIYNIGEITPVFVGSCIMGLKKTSNNTYQVAKVFHLNYHFNDCMHESAQELIRDYSGTFGKYQQEIKGSVNYLTGVAEGLLGYEVDGGYAEPNNIKNDWLEFINDDSLKLYKGMDGNTMLVSITTSKIKPRYYEEYGLVNEVNISYKQIGDTNNIAIYDLEV